jgi:hypothetical protein
VVEKTLTAVVPKVLPKPSKITYQWFVGGTLVLGATKSTFQPDGNQVGRAVQVRVSYESTNYNTTHRFSTVTAAVVRGALQAAKPTISGTAVLGQVLTAKVPSWTPQATLTTEWFADDVSLNATGNTLLLTTNELGKRISIRVTGQRFGYENRSISSDPTQAVLLPIMPKIGSPKVVMEPGKKYVVGSILQVSRGNWDSNTSFTYQWLRNGVIIASANESTYTLTSSDLGKKISLRLSGSLEGFRVATSFSSATSVIGKGSLVAGIAPQISGMLIVGNVLLASGQTWLPGAETVQFQWSRNGVAIKGANSQTYTLTTSDRGKNISVSVTGGRVGYNNLTLKSISTVKIQ